jgi:hypothetical protein
MILRLQVSSESVTQADSELVMVVPALAVRAAVRVYLKSARLGAGSEKSLQIIFPME